LSELHDTSVVPPREYQNIYQMSHPSLGAAMMPNQQFSSSHMIMPYSTCTPSEAFISNTAANNMPNMKMFATSSFAQKRVKRQSSPLHPKKAMTMKFPMKLMLLLCNDEISNIISFNEKGDRFTIHDSKRFCHDVLPKYFKASKFPSFLRKLYRWGFVKRPKSKGISKNIHTYFHPKFQRGEFKLCETITSKDTSLISFGSGAPASSIRMVHESNTMYPQETFSLQNGRRNYNMEMPAHQMNVNPQFYNQSTMMNVPSYSLGSGGLVSSLITNGINNGNNANYYGGEGGTFTEYSNYHSASI